MSKKHCYIFIMIKLSSLIGVSSLSKRDDNNNHESFTELNFVSAEKNMIKILNYET